MVSAATLSPSRKRIVQLPPLRSRCGHLGIEPQHRARRARALAGSRHGSPPRPCPRPPARRSRRRRRLRGFSNGWRRSASAGSSQRTLGTRRANSAAAFCMSACLLGAAGDQRAARRQQRMVGEARRRLAIEAAGGHGDGADLGAAVGLRMQRRRAAGRVIGRDMLALENDHARCGREVVGDGNAGDAGADDGEIEILHAPSHCKAVTSACNSWARHEHRSSAARLVAQEFRDLTALARGDAAHLNYRDLWRKVSVMSTHLSGALRPVARRSRRLRHDQLRRSHRGHVRHLARRPLRGADERQAACQGVRLHPREFRRQALLRDARPRRDHRRGREGGAGAEGDRRRHDARLQLHGGR